MNPPAVHGFAPTRLEAAWIEGDESACWRSTAGHGPAEGAEASGSSLLEIEPGRRLPRHTDSAEEVIVVVAGAATIEVGGDTVDASAGDLVVVPAGVPHEVRNRGGGALRFVAVYAGTDVTTTYEEEVQPDGERERQPVS